MNRKGNRKQYVEVIATHRIDGTVRPQKITFAAGPIYDITEARPPNRTITPRTGESALAYPIRVGKKETTLYEDGGRWFVMMRE